MEEFAAQCRAWYYDQDDQAGRAVSQTMNNLPPSHRAAYMKLQASIRSAYHSSVAARRLAEFKAQLSSVTPGGSLTPAARANPHGPIARKERYDRLSSFISTWCTPTIPGPRPFFQGLWALMRLQALTAQLGGAGHRLIEWEIDDAVFRETAGKDFMFAALTVMKGVLGFQEYSRPSCSPSQSTTDLNVGTPQDLGILPEVSSASQDDNIYSSQSDPFLDKLNSNLPAPASPLRGNTESLTKQASLTIPLLQDGGFDRLDEQRLRIWVAPDLSNPEYLSLLALFPSNISQREVPLFKPPSRKSRKQHDLESGLSAGEEKEEVECGTGRMWVGATERSLSMLRGGLWDRFLSWWRSIFC